MQGLCVFMNILFISLTAGFSVAWFDLVFLSLALLSSVLGWRAGAGAGAYGAAAPAEFIAFGPRAPAGPARIHC